uniref:Uncharacterized protein n=1 Tax=Ditylenchus dipsaci TaxID=166011 RepID=A0A915E2M5_9BILA
MTGTPGDCWGYPSTEATNHYIRGSPGDNQRISRALKLLSTTSPGSLQSPLAYIQ